MCGVPAATTTTTTVRAVDAHPCAMPSVRRTRVGAPSGPAKRLVILLADTPVPTVLEQRGSYHDVFAKLFERSLASADAVPTDALDIESYDAVAGQYPDDGVLAHADGLLITGSGACAIVAADTCTQTRAQPPAPTPTCPGSAH